MAFVEIRDLSFTYNGAVSAALKNVNLTVERGDFVLVFGESGCGKTTLLKLLKKQLRPSGRQEGSVLVNGQRVEDADERASVSGTGFVMQDPETQIVTDKVWHELAFGLESLGEKTGVIRQKVAEICGFFGVGSWFRKRTCELSGGEKQILALASVMVMNPSLLILDEPTSQLDPIAASEFLAALKRINDELGVTVIIAEHRLEEVFPMANKAVLMDGGEIFMCDAPRNVGKLLSQSQTSHKMSLGLPAAVRLFYALGKKGECPLTVKEGKKFISENYRGDISRLPPAAPPAGNRAVAIEVAGGYFRYERELPDVLRGLDLKVYENEILCILGANGAGKTTLLRVLSGVKRLYKGKLRIWGKKIKEFGGNSLYRGNLACLPQDPRNLFVKSTVRADLKEITKIAGYAKEEGEKAVEEVLAETGITNLCESHPYDLSGGERQKAALAKILLMKPRILLLDEPTKGLDAYSKRGLAALLSRLKGEGKTIVMVTHDVEFAAEYADRCAMFFDGQIVSADGRVEFFASNSYYTTAAARITRPMYENAVTVELAAELCRLNGEKQNGQ